LNEVVLLLDRISVQALHLLQEFQRAHLAKTTHVRPARPPWKPPDPGELKANFDGAVFEDLSSAGIEVVVRNS